MHEKIRLNKLLAEQLGISRREADEYISRGRVSINGVPAALGARIVRDVDIVALDNKPVATTPVDFTYILFNKPVGYVCSRRKQGDIPTIYELLPEEYHRLKPVGRLDKDSSGILLLTDDGDLAHQMTHPSYSKVKIYYVTLDKPLEPLHQQMVSDHGIELEDGTSHFLVSSLTDTPEAKAYPNNTYRIEMKEGRNRQIRRTFAALGYEVEALHRTQFGGYALGTLRLGTYAPTDALL